MPVYHYIEQGTPEWDRMRLGIPTASEFKKLVTAIKRQPSKQWKDYCYHLLAERILMRQEDHYTSEPMIHGQIAQAEAADWYELDQEVETTKIGFIASNEYYKDSRGYEWPRYGCSPDRLIGEDGLLETKCPTPRVQLKYWFERNVDRQYWPQLQGQLFVSQRQWVDILAWYEESGAPREDAGKIPKVIIRVERDDIFIRLLERTLRDVNEFMDGVMDKLGETQTMPPRNAPTPKATLREMLNAALGV